MIARAMGVVDAERTRSEHEGELFCDRQGLVGASRDGGTDAVERVGRLGAGEGLQRMDAEVDAVERGGTGDMADEARVRTGDEGDGRDRRVGNTEQRDVDARHRLIASEGADHVEAH